MEEQTRRVENTVPCHSVMHLLPGPDPLHGLCMHRLEEPQNLSSVKWTLGGFGSEGTWSTV